ncbi:MAG: hypothetical protein NXH75_09925 [Halobacteriovoraceae bacterium]|nr:hypothetical protein [Halobacteriovoraceae bacterium]
MDLSDEKCEPGMEEFLGEFLTDRKNELKNLKNCDIKEVADDARQIGHKWTGFSRPYGFFRLESLGENLRNAGRDQDQVLFEQALIGIEEYLDEKEKALRK